MTKIIYMNETIMEMQRMGQDIKGLVESGEVVQTENLLYLIVTVKNQEDGKGRKSSKG